MEFIKNETSGLYVVTIGGVRWNNCSVDADCPGYGQCAIGESWMQDATTCTCPMNRFLDGDLCDQMTRVGTFEVVSYSILTALSVIVFFTAIITFVRLYRANHLTLEASSISLLLASIGMLAQAILCGSLIITPLRRPEADPVSGERDTGNLAFLICLPVVFIFSTFAAMNVSLVWMKIADNALRMKSNSHIDLVTYRRSVFAYYTIITAGMLAMLIFRFMTGVLIIATIGIVLVNVTYAYTLWKVNTLVKSFTSSSEPRANTDTDQSGNVKKHSSTRVVHSKEIVSVNSGELPNSDGQLRSGESGGEKSRLRMPAYQHPFFKIEKNADNMKRSLYRIRVLSLRIVIATYLFLGAVIAYAASGAPRFTPETDAMLVSVSFWCIWAENLVLVGYVVKYLHDTARRRLKSSQPPSGSSQGGAGAAAAAVAGPESAQFNGTFASSKPASKEEL